VAHAKLKNKIFNGTLSNFINHNKKTFNVVIYNHVLEHIPNPAEEIKHIKKLLTKNGVLVIGVPNTDNIFFYLRKKYWESLLPDQHIWHFSTDYLKRFLKENGFEVVETSYSNYEREDYPLLKRIYFTILVLLNKMLGTGEAVLLVSKRIETD
jgi:2-polyprenyl-3-methyl-5-hydroxy-6-metoxy-1,4-benzoquinol methylase